jgi:hypothetical protein
MDAFNPDYPTRSKLYPAIRKYGLEHFTFIVLEECEATRETLTSREQHYIDLLMPEYNILPKANSRLGSKSSPETIEKLKGRIISDYQKGRISEASKAYMNDPDVKQYYSALRKGKTFIEIFGEVAAREILQRQSVGRTGKARGRTPHNKGVPMAAERKEAFFAARDAYWAALSEEDKEAWREKLKGRIPWNKGLEWSDEVKQKISESKKGQEAWNKGIPATPEQRARASEIAKLTVTPQHQQKATEAARLVNTGRPRSEETKLKIGGSTPARRAMAERMRGVPRKEEHKIKMSIGQQSEKAKAYHERSRGKRRISRKNLPQSGEYGVTFDASREKWMVKVEGVMYGRFDTVGEAVEARDKILKAAPKERANVLSKLSKGEARRNNSDLTWELVNEIRTSFTGERGQMASFEKKYNVCRASLHKVLKNESWFDPHYMPAVMKKRSR